MAWSRASLGSSTGSLGSTIGSDETAFMTTYQTGSLLYPERQARDAAQTELMEDLGYSVVRFGLSQDWEPLSAQHAVLFGPSRI